MRICRKARISAAAGLLVHAACGSATAPTRQIRITSVRYERVYSPASASTGTMWIEMSIPIAGEQSGRSNIPICFPQLVADGAFVCDAPGWDVPVDDDAWVNVNDPLLGRQVATNVFVNGQRVTRVRSAGTNETGDFRFDAAGRIY